MLMIFKVPTACIPWPDEGLRRISVNSFGFGGSNGHIILDDAYHCLEALGLKGNHNTMVPSAIQKPAVNGITSEEYMADEESTNKAPVNGITTNGILTNGAVTNGITHQKTAPEIPNRVSESPHVSKSESVSTVSGTTTPDIPMSTSKLQLLVWSARDEAALQRVIQQYSEYYKTRVSGSGYQLERLAYTLAAQRSTMTWRSFAVVGTDTTSNQISKSISNSIRSSKETGLAFIFTGQGAQYAKMGMELIQFPIFKATLDRASMVFSDLGAKWSLFGKNLLWNSIH